jgi:hypothetical protein
MLSSPVYANTELRSAKPQPRRATSQARLSFLSFCPSQPSNLQMRFLHPECFCGTFQHANALPASRTHLRDDIQTPSTARHPRALLYRQHRAAISPLPATLTDHPASVANKRLTENLTPLDATLTKYRGLGVFLTFQRSNVLTCNDLRPNSLRCTFLATPHPLTPYPTISYKNIGGHLPYFPSLLARPLPKECFTTPLPSTDSALSIKIAGCIPTIPILVQRFAQTYSGQGANNNEFSNLSESWCPREDSNLHDLAITAT